MQEPYAGKPVPNAQELRRKINRLLASRRYLYRSNLYYEPGEKERQLKTITAELAQLRKQLETVESQLSQST